MTTARALTFGSVAAAYERYRPGYPGELVDEVLSYAGTPIHRALEIGAGTGKATRAFAVRNIAVTATDPDTAMLSELGRQVPGTVTAVHAAFEQLTDGGDYDLVFAAAALHWTAGPGRWERVARLLRAGGTFANFGGQLRLDDPAAEAAVTAARAPFLDSDDVPSPDDGPTDVGMRWPGTELTQSSLFTDVRQVEFDRRSTMTARDYIGHLSTVSAYLQLSVPVREEALGRILRVLPQEVEVANDVVLHLARCSPT